MWIREICRTLGIDGFTTITFIVSESSDISESLPLLAWLAFARRKPPYRMLGILFAITAPLKLFTLFAAKLGIHNMPAYHALALIEVVMVYCFYSQLRFGKIEWKGVVFLSLVNIMLSLFIQGFGSFNSIGWSLDMIFILAIGLSYLLQLYNDETDLLPLEKRPVFMITVAWLLYAAGSLFTYLMANAILSGKAAGFFHNAWIIQCIANLFKNLLISYALWRQR